MIARDTNSAGVTVSVVLSLIEFSVAAMVAVPRPPPVASPWLPKALLMVATVVAEELQVTEVVRSLVLPSVKLPVAANCCLVPKGIEGMAGVTAMESNSAGVTVRSVAPETEPEVAVTVVVPIPVLVARPLLPRLLLTTATAVFAELQVTEVVRSCVLPSVKVPVAANCCLMPSAIEAWVGVTVRETRAAGATLSMVEPLTEPEVAVMVEVPCVTLVAKPWLPAELLTVATLTSEEAQVAEEVRSCVVPSLKVPVALNC